MASASSSESQTEVRAVFAYQFCAADKVLPQPVELSGESLAITSVQPGGAAAAKAGTGSGEGHLLIAGTSRDHLQRDLQTRGPQCHRGHGHLPPEPDQAASTSGTSHR